MSDTIAAVVVTYNRKQLLIECLEAIRKQIHKPDAIFIIDNKSNDGTLDLLLDKEYIPKLAESDSNENQLIQHQVSSLFSKNENISINYIRKFENDGGAGGFYEGMKCVYEAGFDWIWMMDDDGIPEENQLLELLNAPEKYKYRNALVVDINDKSKLAFGLKGYKNVSDIVEEKFIENQANPYNGTIIHREIPGKIGFIKKDMFIWGDENEYLYRVKNANYHVVTVVNSFHYHPKNKGWQVNVIPFVKKYKLTVKPKNMSHIYYRNLAYINYNYNLRAFFIYTFLHLLYFCLHLKFSGLIQFIIYSLKGIRNDFK